MVHRQMLAAVTLSLALGLPAIARAGYDFTTIDVQGSTDTGALAISSHEIAGDFLQGHLHGYVLSNGQFTTIDVPGANLTVVTGINSLGRLAGIYQTGTDHAFFWNNGVVTTLDPPGATFSQGGAMNSHNDVVGGYADGSSHRGRGFIWSKGAFTTVDYPGDPTLATFVHGINDRGEVVGQYDLADGLVHGFLLSRGAYTPLDYPGAYWTTPTGINNAGTIVGFYAFAGEDRFHGFVLKDNVYTTVDVPDSTNCLILSINAKGDIAGDYEDSNDNDLGFVGTPTP